MDRELQFWWSVGGFDALIPVGDVQPSRGQRPRIRRPGEAVDPEGAAPRRRKAWNAFRVGGRGEGPVPVGRCPMLRSAALSGPEGRIVAAFTIVPSEALTK
jgi:hypothetical protein